MEKYWKLLKSLMEYPEVWPRTLELRKMVYKRIGEYYSTGTSWTETVFEQKLFNNPEINELLNLLEKDEKNGEFYWSLFNDLAKDSTKELLELCEEIKRNKK